jgi:hypothetical protein
MERVSKQKSSKSEVKSKNTSKDEITDTVITDTYEFYISKRTYPRKCITSKSLLNKDFEWVQVEDVPCLVKEKEFNSKGRLLSVTLNSFISDPQKCFKVTKEELSEDFDLAKVSDDGYILGLKKYPDGKLDMKEFDKRSDVKKMKTNFKNISKSNKHLASKLKQIFPSQGSTHAITIPKYFKYMNGEKKLKSIENFGDPIFNRAKRWCPPINMNFDEFKESTSYPAPLGIRPKDFCLPSELISSCIELISQMAHFENIDDHSPRIARYSLNNGI